MKFVYSRYSIPEKEKNLERFLEIVPGFLSWSIIIGMAILSFASPVAAAVIMIAFILYWVLRLLYMNIFLTLSYLRLAIDKGTDWMKCVEDVDRRQMVSEGWFTQLEKKFLTGFTQDSNFKVRIKHKISALIRRGQLETLKKSGLFPPASKDIYHLVIITVILEPREVIEPGLVGIKKGSYPSARILVVIAMEDSASAEVKKDMEALQKQYNSDFLDCLVVTHPNNIEGEARVKGANASYAARRAAAYFAAREIPYENIIVSCFDADSVPRPDYFSCLTYHFMVTPGRTAASYQPIPVYHNNIWEVPSFARIIDIGTSFFQLIEATNPRKLVTFSSHSMSFKALVDVGYWPVDMISDDSAIFWKALIHYDGNYRAIPMYTTVSMDIATGGTFFKTFSNIYRQKRRWAWGVENFPIVIRAFIKNRRIPLYDRFSYSCKLLDAFVSWATWSFLLAFVSWLPALFAGKEFASTTVYYIAPRIQGAIFVLASFGVVVCMIISLRLLPKEKAGDDLSKRLVHVLEWFSIPFIVLFLSAIPALDAQTRLLFGRYMEFWVTEKSRNK